MSDLPSRLLYREHYVAAVRLEHPLAKSRTISLESFCSYDHVLVSPTGGSFEGPADEELARIQRRRTVRYSVPSFSALPELLQIDDLIALVPSRLPARARRAAGAAQVAYQRPRLRRDRSVAPARREGYCASLVAYAPIPNRGSRLSRHRRPALAAQGRARKTAELASG